MERICRGIAWCCGCLAALAMSSLEAQNPVEIREKHQNRSRFFGTIYEYDVDYENVLEATPLSSLGQAVQRGRRVLTIGHFDSESYRIPIRIEHFAEQNEPYLESGEALIFWEAFDGNESRRFNRSLFGNGESRIEHECHVDAGALQTMLGADPFKGCLFALTNASNHFGGMRIPDWKPDMSKQVVTTGFEAALGELLIVNEEHTHIRAVFSSGPEFHLIRTDVLGMRVESLINFGGTRYPRGGTFDAKAWKGAFTLRAVKPLPREFNEWFTEWPNGSVVINSIDGSVKRIPYSDIESEKIRKFFDGGAVSDIDLAERSRGYLFYVNLAMLFGIVVLVVLRILHGRRQQKS